MRLHCSNAEDHKRLTLSRCAGTFRNTASRHTKRRSRSSSSMPCRSWATKSTAVLLPRSGRKSGVWRQPPNSGAFISLAGRELDPAGWSEMDKVVIDLLYERAAKKASARGSRQRSGGKARRMDATAIKKLLDALLSRERAKELLIELVKVPSPQTELLEAEPLLKEFISKAIEPRLRAMGFSDIRYDGMGNLIAEYGAGASGKSLMFIGNAMNQPASTMPNPYNGDVVDGAKFGLPGECVMGKGASEQKANLAAMLHAMETVLAAKVPIEGRLIFTCCLSGETGKHDAIRSVVESAGVCADMAVLGGTGLKIALGNRGRIDVFVTVKGSPCHSARPWDGANAITGAIEAIRLAARQGKARQQPPRTRQAGPHRQSYPQLSGLDAHGAGTLRVHARSPAVARRGPRRGFCRN